jgi:hypothetical protein
MRDIRSVYKNLVGKVPGMRPFVGHRSRENNIEMYVRDRGCETVDRIRYIPL